MFNQSRSISTDAAAAASQFIKERDYWLKQLSGELVKTVIPYDFHQRETHTALRGFDAVSFRCSSKVYEKLIQLSKDRHHTLHMVLVAGVLALFYKYTGNNDIIVGMPIYKQESGEKFVNTVLPLRSTVSNSITFKDLLIQVKQTVVDAVKHQNYPMESLINKLYGTVAPEDFPLFDAAVLLENIHQEHYISHINFNLLFSFLQGDSHIKGMVKYNALHYKKTTIEALISHFINLLDSVLFDVNMEIGDIDMLSPGERNRLLKELNNNTADYSLPPSPTIVRLFEQQAAKTPDLIALVSSRQLAASEGTRGLAPLTDLVSITYRELNEKSKQLAYVLKQKGVTPGTIVGITAERSIEMIKGMIGIMKVGGAYLPIDPEYGSQRVTTLLEDSNAPVLVTTNEALANRSFTCLQNRQSLQSLRVTPVKTLPRPPIDEPDLLPVTDRSLVNHEPYHGYIGQALVKHCLSLQATRGCPYRCAYCHRIMPKIHIARSARHIFEEVQLYYHMGVRRFAFIDDLFNLDSENGKRFFQLMIDNGLQAQLFFPNGLYTNGLTKEYIDLMVEAGTIGMALALETASPRLQRLIKKNLDLEKLEDIIRYLCQEYPQVILELFTLHGIPSETEEEAMETLEFIKRCKWIHFPYINILKIYPNTEMETIARDHDISQQAINNSVHLAVHELPETLPFEKSFTLNYQSMFLNEYFLCKERLLHVLPLQAKVLSEDEMVQKYNSYLPVDIGSFSDLLEQAGISPQELKGPGGFRFLQEERVRVPDLDAKMAAHFPARRQAADALKVLLLDLSQSFSHESQKLHDPVEAPLGLMVLLTYLLHRFGEKIKGKIAKSRIDFDNYDELKEVVETFKPDVIGIRTLVFYKDFFHKTISLMRQWGVEVPIIAGGPYATTSFQQVLQDKNIDLVVLGEGEVTFSEVIDKIMENKKNNPDHPLTGKSLVAEQELGKIPGIAYAGKNNGFSREILMLEAAGLTSTPAVPCRDDEGGGGLSGSDLAYTIFTSGSTGTPKGAAIEHGSIVNTLLWRKNYYQFNPDDVVLQVPSFSFDSSVEDIFTPLISGSRLLLLRGENRWDVTYLQEVVEREGVTHFLMVPGLYKSFLEHLERPLKTMRTVTVAGEHFKGQLVRTHREKLPGVRLVNEYGPTETSVCATVYPFENKKETGTGGSDVLIGKPIGNCFCYILDRDQNLMPIGIVGQLYITGKGLARGYLNRPELTAEKFVEQVTGACDRCRCINKKFLRGSRGRFLQKEPPGRRRQKLYQTGDLARWLENGNIEYLGRVDFQVKIRGFRIEPGEIEKQLLKHEAVNDAVVIAKESETGEKYLCAYIAAVNQEQEPGSAQWREYLSGRLPDYMIPSYFVLIECIPLTANGKVDRKALPEPVKESQTAYAAPRDEIEKKLTGIWSEVLDIDVRHVTIGIDDNFFELGGHSLNATSLTAKIHKKLDVKISLAEMFRTPTIRGMAEYIKTAARDRYISIAPVEKKEYYPLSSAQMGLYIEQHRQVGNTSYNAQAVVELEGELDMDRVRETFLRMSARHEMLRTSFIMVGNEPAQRIHNEVEFEIEFYDLEVTSAGDRCRWKEDAFGVGEGEPATPLRNLQPAAALISSFIRPFDLSRPPLYRVGIIKHVKPRHIVVLDLHHIIMDGISINIFFTEFLKLYSSSEENRSLLSELRIQYKDFSRWQHQWKNSSQIKQQEAFWLEEFSGEVPILNMPTDFKRSELQDFAGSRIGFAVNSQETTVLKELALKEDATLFMVMIALFYIFISRWCDQEDIVIGTSLSGRFHGDLEQVLGHFINMLALRSYLYKEKTFEQFLQEVKQKVVRAYDHQAYPFDDLVNNLFETRTSGRHSLVDVVFVFQNQEILTHTIPGIEMAGLKLKPYEHQVTRTPFDLVLQVFDAGNRLDFMFYYKTNLFKEESIKWMIANFKKVVSAVVENTRIKIKDISLTHGFLVAESDIDREGEGDFDF